MGKRNQKLQKIRQTSALCHNSLILKHTSYFSGCTRAGLNSSWGRWLMNPAVQTGRGCRTKYLHFLLRWQTKGFIREKHFNVFLE